MRADDRAQLRALLAQSMDDNHGQVPDRIARGAAQAFRISTRSVHREAARLRAADPDPAAAGWWADPVLHGRVLAAVGGSDTMKQAWRRLAENGTLGCSYVQFTRQFRAYVAPAVAAAVRGNGREDYLEHSIYCTDVQPHRNGRWQADAQEVPVWVQGDRGELPFKPYQLTFEDEATRTIVATILLQGRPSGVDTIACMAAAVRGHRTADGTFLGGIPDSVRWDNGREFLNDAVTEVCARLGIGPLPSAPHAAFQKGKIERWHQTIQSELFAGLPGASDGPTTFTGRQPWRGDDHQQLLSFSALSLLVEDWVTRYNTDRRHSAIGSTPLEAWKANTAPIKYATAEQIHPLMLRVTKPRTVNKDGISYANIKFQAPELGRYARRKVQIRVLPNDLTSIAVFDGDQFICTASQAARMTPEQRRRLVRQRHQDYQTIKTAFDQAAQQRRQDAIVAQALAAEPATAPDTVSGDAPALVVADDAALLALMDEEGTA